MLILPAIDLIDGQVVRLYKGIYEQKKVYSSNPVNKAKEFEKLGAKYIHIVDLDGAREGKNINTQTIKKIRENVNIPIQIGGGIRNKETVKLYLEDIKVDRVIIGTSALKNPEFLRDVLKEFGAEKIVISVDVKDNKVSISGWQQISNIDYIDFIKELEQIGIKYILVTDISKDGALIGPNFEMYQEIKKNTNINFIVSGGVRNLQDIKELSKLDYYGCIVGKAIYEGNIKLEDIV